MAKRRKGHQDEVMLIPFLDILCSLIGILVLIIAFLCVAQTQKSRGRTKEEMARAEKYQSLTREKTRQDKETAALQARLESLTRKAEELAAQQAHLAELRKRLDLSGDEAKANKEAAERMQKQLEVILAQIAAIQKQLPPILSDIEKLKKELAERTKKPDNAPPPILVRPSGSGIAGGSRMFFVETSGPSVIIHKSKTEKLRIGAASVGSDQEYNAYLQSIKETSNASLIFLIRPDGFSTYRQAAGWAEQRFGITTAKLPMPAGGEVDLSLFGFK